MRVLYEGMCARYRTPSQAAAERYWRTVTPLWRFSASWRVLPTQQVPVIIRTDEAVTGRMMRWGLLPFQGSLSYPLINATVEKLESWYGWRHPWQRRQRCILVMAGFYEPHLAESGRKEPFYVELTERALFGVAGLWDRRGLEDGTEQLSCTLITVPANGLLARVHNEKQRMPAILREQDQAAWLEAGPEQAKALLRPYPEGSMTAWQVSRRLYARNSPDDASLIAPVT